eukprot:bmy_06965T0
MPNPIDEMTEEQKEYEAMKLVNMLDKLSSQPYIKNRNPCAKEMVPNYAIMGFVIHCTEVNKTSREELLKPMGLKPDGTITPLEEALNQYSVIEETSSDTD